MLGKLTVLFLLFCASAAAQNTTIKLNASGAISGAEEYTITQDASGKTITGHTSLSQAGNGVEYQYKINVGTDCSVQKYEAKVVFRGDTHAVTVTRQGDQVKMARDDQEKSLPYTNTVALLDNSIMSQFQLLAACFGKAGEQQLTLLVPQGLASVPGKLTKAAIEEGTLSGKAVRAQKYTVNLAGVSVDFWTDAASGDLLRVANQGQNFYATRESFTLPEKKVPTGDSSPAATNYAERDIKFGSGSLQIPGTLCLPKDAKTKLPVVVLVHGSGPHDRDETVGPNKPFAEIAHALSAAGIATLRYDKRTVVAAMSIDIKTLTLDQEVTDDAVAALTFAASQPEIDVNREFVLGHSLGGTMAPYIAQRYPKLRGVILMAAGSRPIDQIIKEQVRFQLRTEGKSEAEIAEAIKRQDERFAAIRSAPADQVINGVSAGYWRDWLARDPAKVLKSLPQPALVLQAGSDLQVSSADYDLLKAAIAGKPHREAHLFPNLTHLFSIAPPNQTFADLQKPAHVEPEVTEVIAKWIASVN